MNYAKAIRVARSIADISQAQLAELSGIDRSYLSLIESERRKPTLSTIENISSALKLPFHVLTLMATEQSDKTNLEPQQVNRLGQELTKLLIEGIDAGSQPPQLEADSKPSGVGVSVGGDERAPKKPPGREVSVVRSLRASKAKQAIPRKEPAA